MDVITELIAAMSAYDAEATRALCAPDARHWVSLTEQEQGIDDMVALMAREGAVVAEGKFDVRSRIATENGAVLMMTVDGTTNGGAKFHIPLCLVVTLDGDKIVRLDEYANVDQAKDLLREIFAS